jgi:alkaline phosphatase
MKLRNRLIALACLLAFAGLGVLYFRTWVVQKPFGIILFVSDGLTASRIAAARQYAGGADNRLHLESFPALAFLSNHSADFAVPDTAAAASAIATGTKVSNRGVASAPDGRPLVSLLEAATRKGRATGLVTNGRLSDPAPAAFYAHAPNAADRERLTAQLAEDPRITVLLGGGSDDFLPESKEGGRKDGRDLLLEIRQKGYDVVRTGPDLESTPPWRFPRVLGLFGRGELRWSNSPHTGAQEPSLEDMVRSAINLLQFNRSGYVLVVDAGLVRHAAAANRGEQTLAELIELDRAIHTARSFAGDSALIVAAGLHASGGFSLNGFPLRKDSGAALVGPNSSGVPSITWATGPNGPGTDAPQGPVAEPAAHASPESLPTAEDPVAVGTGPGSESLRGFIDNTDLFRIIEQQF